MTGLQRMASCLTLLAMSTSAIAQSSNTLSDARTRDSRAQAGIVIPFGKSGTRAERAPRLEIWSEQAHRHNLANLPVRADRDSTQDLPVRIGIPLNSQPRMLRNGREIPGQSDRHGVSALGWVGIGIGVAALVVGAAVLGAFGSFST